MNDELLPYQHIRKRKVTEQTPETAIFSELHQYFSSTFPSYPIEDTYLPPQSSKDAQPPVPLATKQKTTLTGSIRLPSHLSLSSLAYILSPICSPNQRERPSSQLLSQLEAPVMHLYILKKLLCLKSPLLALPHPYRAAIKMVYTQKTTQQKLAEYLASQKRSKKYLRIFQKRLGIYQHKKPPFTEK